MKPLTLFLVIVAALTVTLGGAWKIREILDSQVRAYEASEKLSKATFESGKALREQIAHIRTAEDRTAALAKAYEAVAEAQAEIAKSKPGTPERQEAETQELNALSSVRILNNIPLAGLAPNEAEMERRVSERFFNEWELPMLEAKAIALQGTAAARLKSLNEQLRILKERARYAEEHDAREAAERAAKPVP